MTAHVTLDDETCQEKSTRASGPLDGLLFVLAAATGLRAGELLGLEIRHFDGRSIKVEQSVWRRDVQSPKTQNAYRIVDLHPDVAKMLSDFVGGRRGQYIFTTSDGKPLGQSNILRRSCIRFWQASE